MRIQLIVYCWVFLGVSTAQAIDRIPALFTSKQFNAATLAEAANHYIELGEVRAIQDLKELSEQHAAAIDARYDTNERIGWICRIVFQGKEHEPLRPPRFGALNLPYLTMPLDRWPLYPVAESEGVFFVLSEGYARGGQPEPASKYIDFCSTAGEFRTGKIKEPTRAEAVQAFESLKTAKRWTMIKWIDEQPGTQYSLSEERKLRDIEQQATSIGDNNAFGR